MYAEGHKSLHILGDWWPWPSPNLLLRCVSVLEDGGSLLGTQAFCYWGPTCSNMQHYVGRC